MGVRVPVSVKNSEVLFAALKSVGINLISALPETWLVHLMRMADDDPDMTLLRLNKEEEGVGISAGAAVPVALDVAGKLGPTQIVVTMLPDTGERDFSLDEYFQ